MDTDGFWDVIEAARSSACDSSPFHEVLTDLLASRTEQEILDYQEKFEEAQQGLYRWDVWGAFQRVSGDDHAFWDALLKR